MSAVALDLYRFDGDELELVSLDGEGWVSLPSLLRPFGKRADNVAALLEGWARTRVEDRVPSRKGDGRFSGKEANASVTLIHIEDAPLLIARLDQRGMSDVIKSKHTRYLRTCARALADFFSNTSTDDDTSTYATIGDSPAESAQLRLAAARVVRATGSSLQRVYGYIRRTRHVSSPFKLPSKKLKSIVDDLEQLELGHVHLLKPKERRLLEAQRRSGLQQQTLPWGTN